jgi:hypothetical protein
MAAIACEEAGLGHRLDRAPLPDGCGQACCDCACFEFGCMVSKTPGLLRRR